MAGYLPERRHWQAFVAMCLIVVFCGAVYYGQLARGTTLRQARGSVGRLEEFVSRLDAPSPPPGSFKTAWCDLLRRIMVAECLQEVRWKHPDWELPRLSPERLQLAYAQAWELADDTERGRMGVVEERYQRTLAFTVAEAD